MIFSAIEKIIRNNRLVIGFLRKLKYIYNSIRRRIIRLRMSNAQSQLAMIKHAQKDKFYMLRNNFSNIYEEIDKNGYLKYATSFWANYNLQIEKIMLPVPPFSFLENSIISRTMFVAAGGMWLNKELAFLEKNVPVEKLKTVLEEDYVGDPLLLNAAYLTSHNSIHHLHHLIRFIYKTHCNIEQINTVVEWGGGYGNMAKLFKRFKSSKCTYIIVDTPLFSCIQWLYLASIFGEEDIKILKNDDDGIEKNKINLIPVCFVNLHNITADLFISTWALSESSKYSLEYVISRNWFNSKQFLLAYSSTGVNVEDSCKMEHYIEKNKERFIVESIEFIQGNHSYAFR